ncbi:MAG: hypothetical protein FWC40_03020 [Proteobacteria bacterium]|nr:hypothetical protein [Pseudomonadota bacterium]
MNESAEQKRVNTQESKEQESADWGFRLFFAVFWAVVFGFMAGGIVVVFIYYVFHRSLDVFVLIFAAAAHCGVFVAGKVLGLRAGFGVLFFGLIGAVFIASIAIKYVAPYLGFFTLFLPIIFSIIVIEVARFASALPPPDDSQSAARESHKNDQT